MMRRAVLAAFLPLLFLCSGLVSQTGEDTPLAKAVKAGDLATARALLASGADPKDMFGTTDPYQRMTLLMEASLLGNADMVALLLDAGAELNAVDRYGLSALSYAVTKPEGAAAALYLIGKGAKTDVLSYGPRGDKVSILKAAALKGMVPVVDALAPAAGEAGRKELAEAMRWVGAQGRVDLVEAFLSRGVQPIWDDMERSDSLVRAAESGYLDVIVAEMKRGARADSPDGNAVTPLMAAAANGRLEVLRYLLDKGAKVLATDAQGKRALSHLNSWYPDGRKDPSIPASELGYEKGYAAMSELLSKAGASLDLFYAIRAGDLSNVKKLATSGKVNSRDGDGSGARAYWSNNAQASWNGQLAGPSPLYVAVALGRSDIAKILVEKGALVDDPCVFCGKYDFYSMRPLEEAVRGGKEEMVAFLLGKGARTSDELLADAAAAQSLGIVKLLVDKGANVNATWPGTLFSYDDEGEGGYERIGDVLSAAVKQGPSPVVDYLRKKGAKLSGYVLGTAVIAGNAALVRQCLAAGIKADVSELVVACCAPDDSIARDLVKSGVDVNGKDSMGRSPLIVAADYEKVALVKFLVENGADAGRRDGREGETALGLLTGRTSQAARDIVDYLRQVPPGPGALRVQKELSQAVLKKDPAAAKRSLDAGADPSLRFMPPEGSDLSDNPPSLLDVACLTESKEVIQLFLSRGALLEDADKGLAYLAADGRLDLVELVLSAKTKQDDFYRKARLNQVLCIACKTGNLPLASLALSKGADPNLDYYGNPLAAALAQGSVPVATLLLERGADLMKANVSEYAVSRLFKELLLSGKRDDAKLLLPRVGKNRYYLASDLTCLSAAIRSGDRPSFDWLLANGADPNLAERTGDSPLHAAVDSGDLSLAQALLEKGASLEALDGKGETAAMRAAAMPERQAFLAAFLKRGAKAGVPGLKGFTLIDAIMGYGAWNDEILALASASYASFPATDPALDRRQRLYLALMKGDYAQAVSILDGAKGLVDIAPFRGRTALMGFAARGDAEGLKRLLAKGADASIRDASGLTALSEAARTGIREAVDLLLARMPAKPDPREEALRQAAYAGRTELLKAFIDAGVDPQAAPDNGPAALYLAAGQGRKDCVNILLKEGSSKGAKFDIDRRFGSMENKTAVQSLTAAEAALSGGFFDTAALLADSGARVDWLKAANKADPRTRGLLFRLFLSRAGADEKKNYGSGLLALAARAMDLEAVKLLMAAGIDPTAAFNSAISANFFWKDEEDILALLAAKSSPAGLYSNVLEIAVEQGKSKLAKALLDAGLDPNGRGESTWWAEHPSLFRLAAFGERPEIMRLLLAKGAKESLSPPELAFLIVPLK